ncbi:MAG: hypothetical protein IJ675_08090 [Pseudobutyrivibrio sp.]|nr:hypothetical protein [Pseudobutyrivibrio sp.]
MPYILEECEAGKVLERECYFTYRVKREPEKRQPKVKPSTDATKKYNTRQRIKKLRRLMNENFQDGDYLATLDFFKNKNLSNYAMQKEIEKFLRKMRTAFKKSGKEFKYIYTKEIGPRGSRHIHILMPKCDLDLIRKCWINGGINVKPLYSDGQYSKIAEYFIKYSEKTENTLLEQGEKIGKAYYPSRNLKKPKVKKKVVSARQFKRTPTERKGYYLDKESVQEGISELTGYEYFSYSLIKLDLERGSPDG